MIVVNKYMLYNMIFLPLLHPPFCHYIIKKPPILPLLHPFSGHPVPISGHPCPSRGIPRPFTRHPTTFSPPFYACQRRIPPSQSPDCVGLTASLARVPYYILSPPSFLLRYAIHSLHFDFASGKEKEQDEEDEGNEGEMAQNRTYFTI